jgi:CubicO group peptidase (beta-lactamase class C family)
MSIYKSKEFGISKDEFDLIYKLNSTKNVILVVFGSPYSLQYFSDIKNVLMAYEDTEIMQQVAAQAIFGVTKIQGKLPVGVNATFPIATGFYRQGLFRLGYALPESVGICSDSLLAIDTIIEEMLNKKAAPGCQILAAKDGKIFFNKSYGHHTPNGSRKVKEQDVYDLASVTKILSTTISLMKLYDEGKLNLHEPIKKYIANIDTTNKADLIIEDILAHHSGLPGWIPFYENTMDKESKTLKRLAACYNNTASDSFDIKVCQDLYLRGDWKDSIYNMIYCCELKNNKDYRYSDLGFYLFHQLIEQQSNMKLEDYVQKQFYIPLGLTNTMYNPDGIIDKDRLVPSEKDDYFRDQVIQGYVHDMGAAMLGGVSGHAGLFSNSKEVAVLMQMLLNGGTYAGREYIKPQTIEKFTKRYYKSSRRGLGFDMKELNGNNSLNMAEEASDNTFGHLGFTGISVFADPDYNLIYVFLSNRTYPTMKNHIFAKENYRPRVQSVFYKAMKKAGS